MRTMRFNDRLIPWILDGRKTATTRIGHRNFRVGERLRFAGADGEPVGLLVITDVKHCLLDELDDGLARLENLASADALRAALREIYADRVDNEPLTVVVFRVETEPAAD